MFMDKKIEGVEIRKIPTGESGIITRRDLVDCYGIDGKPISVPLTPIEHKPIPPEWASMFWFVVRTVPKIQPPSKPRVDQIAASEIAALQLPVFMPIAYREVRERLANGRTGKGWDPKPYLIFPSFLLVALGGNDIRNLDEIFTALLNCRHVHGLMKDQSGQFIQRIPNQKMDKIIEDLNGGYYNQEKGVKVPPDSPRLGELARICSGHFENYTGKVIRFKDVTRDEERIRVKALVRVTGLGMDPVIECDIDSLERHR